MSTVSLDFISALRDASIFTAELPQQDALDIYAQLREREQLLVLGKVGIDPLLADYVSGSATIDDQLDIINKPGQGILLTAEHATRSPRKDPSKPNDADHGTAGITALLADTSGATALIPVGRQVTAAPLDADHPIKHVMADLLLARPGFLSVHGMEPGKLVEFTDTTEIHAILGVGPKPNLQSLVTAEAIIRAAADMDLRVKLGLDFRFKMWDEEQDELKRDENGEIKTSRLNAMSRTSTVNHANTLMKQANIQMPALQLELTRLLRMLPADYHQGWHKDEKARAMGVYLGYKLAEAAMRSILITHTTAIGV